MMNSADLCEGVLRRSPFMDLAGFNIITSIPLEPMHAFHLGVTSSIVRKLFFKAGVFGKTERNEMSEALSALLVQTKLPSDFSRRTDVLDAANAKASTWQLLDTFVFFELADKVVRAPQVKKLLLIYAFIVRTVYSSDWVYEQVKQQVTLKSLLRTFYELFEKIFSKFMCTYHLHIMDHVIEERDRHGPMWAYSAGKYEHLYGKLRRCLVKGTFNISKQVMTNHYSAESYGHRCFGKRILKDPKDYTTTKNDDSLIVVDDVFYKVRSIAPDEITMRCSRVRMRPFQPSAMSLPYGSVGVFRFIDFAEEEESVSIEAVDGKAVIVGSIIMHCYHDWLLP
jgi:hypothetical protein